MNLRKILFVTDKGRLYKCFLLFECDIGTLTLRSVILLFSYLYTSAFSKFYQRVKGRWQAELSTHVLAKLLLILDLNEKKFYTSKIDAYKAEDKLASLQHIFFLTYVFYT